MFVCVYVCVYEERVAYAHISMCVMCECPWDGRGGYRLRASCLVLVSSPYYFLGMVLLKLNLDVVTRLAEQQALRMPLSASQCRRHGCVLLATAFHVGPGHQFF